MRFVHGQRLRADDLADAAGGGRRIQELHVVAAHGTWGTALGLDVRAGPLGVRVSPGLAYDAYGRALILEQTSIVAVPDALSGMSEAADLVLSWSECAPELRLVVPADTRAGLDVELARIWLEEGAPGDPDLSYRRCVRSLAAPRVGSGSATLEVTLTGANAVYDFIVDTSNARFQSTPEYTITPSFDTAVALVRDLRAGAMGPYVSIRDPARSSFTVEVRMERSQIADIPAAFTVGVDWLGVESPPTCPPTLAKLKSIEVT